MKLSRGARRDNLFCRFFSVSQRLNFIFASNCLMFVPINSLSSMFSRKVIASCTSRQWETHAVFGFFRTMGFLGHNFGSRHARRSIKGCIDADDHLVSQVWAKILAHWIGVQGQSKLVKISKTPPLCDVPPREPLTQMKYFFFNRN